jgi:hypothetical protein
MELNVNIHILFYEISHEPLNLNKRSLVQLNIMDVHTSFIWIVIFFEEAFKRGDGAKIWGYVGSYA